MDLTTNSNVVSDVLKYVNGNAEKLSAAAAVPQSGTNDEGEDYELL
jgi:hypothetical protein